MKPLGRSLLVVVAVALGGCTPASEPGVNQVALTQPAASRAQTSALALRSKLLHSRQGLHEEQRPDGIKKLQLAQRFQSAYVMAIDGQPVCVDSPAGLDQLIGPKP